MAQKGDKTMDKDKSTLDKREEKIVTESIDRVEMLGGRLLLDGPIYDLDEALVTEIGDEVIDEEMSAVGEELDEEGLLDEPEVRGIRPINEQSDELEEIKKEIKKEHADTKKSVAAVCGAMVTSVRKMAAALAKAEEFNDEQRTKVVNRLEGLAEKQTQFVERYSSIVRIFNGRLLDHQDAYREDRDERARLIEENLMKKEGELEKREDDLRQEKILWRREKERSATRRLEVFMNEHVDCVEQLSAGCEVDTDVIGSNVNYLRGNRGEPTEREGLADKDEITRAVASEFRKLGIEQVLEKLEKAKNEKAKETIKLEVTNRDAGSKRDYKLTSQTKCQS
uniref:cilia- and flagella-associated protein 53-like n=1 Tax=Osmia lignaria TaxID=473952 RepID=UPI0014786DD7|nr:cilia- and flagella-associated protein 53-like [Osmia lignaria]